MELYNMPFAKHDLASSQKEKELMTCKHPKNIMWKKTQTYLQQWKINLIIPYMQQQECKERIKQSPKLKKYDVTKLWQFQITTSLPCNFALIPLSSNVHCTWHHCCLTLVWTTKNCHSE
jgi:hypothetical protein